MTDTSPRNWAMAALAGAAAVVLPIAMLIAAIDPTLADSLGFRPSEAGNASAGLNVAAIARTVGLATVVGAIVGLPIALAVTGLMAVLEALRPAARTLAAWVAAGAIAGLPVIYLAFVLIREAPIFAGLGDLVGVVGAAVAWFARHGRAGRLA